MTQESFNALAILHSHKDILDKLSLVAICNDFVDDLPNRRNNLGIFPDPDLTLKSIRKHLSVKIGNRKHRSDLNLHKKQ